MSNFSLTTSEILDLFTEEIEIRSGAVINTFDDGQRLFTRATLPLCAEVRPRDRVQGGVALKATDKICVYPYVLREVCSNGAIMAHALEAHRLDLPVDAAPEEVAFATREAIEVCCRDEVFAHSLKGMRSIASNQIDLAITSLVYLSQIPPGLAGRIAQRLFRERDSTGYGVMNAITSVARDTEDPEDRWRLEELGGSVLAEVFPQVPTDSDSVRCPGHDVVRTR